MDFPYILRDYQAKAVSDTYRLIKQSKKRILLFAPIGGGKTIISTKIVHDAVSRDRRVLFVVHRDILVGQTYKKFYSVGLRCGFFKAGWEEDINAPVQIASVQTLPNREEWKNSNFDLIIFDKEELISLIDSVMLSEAIATLSKLTGKKFDLIDNLLFKECIKTLNTPFPPKD